MLESLIALGMLHQDKEMISINPSIVQVGLFQKEKDNFYIITPNSNKRFPVSKSVAAGYKIGDVLDVVIDFRSKKPEVIILGKSQKEFNQQNSSNSKSHSKRNLPKNHKEFGDCLLGRVVKTSHDELTFIPNRKNLPTRRIPILNNREELASFQDRICVMKLINTEAPLLGGHIIEVHGLAGNPMHEIEAIARFYNAVIDWDRPDLKAAISQIPDGVDLSSLDLISEEEADISQKGKTVNHLNLNFKTVDPKDCMDMDDAIATTFDENGDFVTYTAVSNLTKYLPLDNPIAHEYFMRCFTLYTQNRAYGVNPPELSTKICSLNEGEDRLALVIKTVIDKNTGEIKASKIYDSVIQSRRKYSYEETQAIIDSLKDQISLDDLRNKFENNKELSLEEQNLLDFYASEKIRTSFDKRKMLRFSSNSEREITLNDDLSQVVDIQSKQSIPSQKVIEYFMLTANIAAAQYAIDNNLNIIHRIHEPPTSSKIDKVNEFFQFFNLGVFDDFSPQTINNILEMVKGTPLEEPANEFLKMQQQRAKYSMIPGRHYGIGRSGDGALSAKMNGEDPNKVKWENYCHFTAPIRRASDAVCHHNILANIHGTKQMSKEQIVHLVENLNQRQIEIDQAEKDIADVYSVNWCEQHIGETFKGSIYKFRLSSPEECFDDRIIVVVKNQEKGFSAEIPLSQILGRKALECDITSQGCAVYDSKGNILLKLCKPIDFIIESVDKVGMNIIARTNKELINAPNARENVWKKHHHVTQDAYLNTKTKRVKRFETKKTHSQHSRQEKDLEKY